MKRVNVVGCCGAGKSTFARALAKKLACPHIELDVLHWGPDWTPREAFLDDLREMLDGESWVTDGNYQKSRSMRFESADTVIWLDYSLPRVLWQLVVRSFARIRSGREVWPGSGCYESLPQLFGSDSVLLWCLRTHRPLRVTYRREMEESALTWIRLRGRGEADRFLAGVESP